MLPNIVGAFPHIRRRYSADGVHLFDRATGLNVLMNEVVPPEEQWSKAPRQISVALTNACDLSCSHCYAPKKKATLDFSLLTQWLLELDKNGAMGIGFGGGEPTLYPRLVELLEFTATKTGLAVTMTTHGHRLTSDHLKHLHFIRVSMDGVGSTYEKIRGRSFENLLNKLTLIKKTTPFGINYVVNATTIESLNEAIQIAESHGASEFLLLPEVSVGKGNGIDEKTFQRMKEWIQNHGGKVRLAVSESHADGLPICQPFKHEKGLQAYAHIDAQGTLKSTSFDKHGIKIGNASLIDVITILSKQEKAGEAA